MRVAVILVAMLGRGASERGTRLDRLRERRRSLIGRMRMIEILWPPRRHHRADGLLEDGGGVHLLDAPVDPKPAKSTATEDTIARRAIMVRGLWRAGSLSSAFKSAGAWSKVGSMYTKRRLGEAVQRKT